MGWLGMAGIVIRSVWKRERIVDPSPTRVEILRARHPLLAKEIRLSGAALLALFVVVGLVGGVGIFLARSSDL